MTSPRLFEVEIYETIISRMGPTVCKCMICEKKKTCMVKSNSVEWKHLFRI